MALSAAVQHSRKRSQTITWKDDDGAAVTLTGAFVGLAMRCLTVYKLVLEIRKAKL